MVLVDWAVKKVCILLDIGVKVCFFRQFTEKRGKRLPLEPLVVSAWGVGGLPYWRAYSRTGDRSVPVGAIVQGTPGRHSGNVQCILGWRAVAVHRLRFGDHAVYLGVDHHAVADLRGADV